MDLFVYFSGHSKELKESSFLVWNFFGCARYKSCTSPVFSYQQNISANFIYFLTALLQNLAKITRTRKRARTEKADSSFLQKYELISVLYDAHPPQK